MKFFISENPFLWIYFILTYLCVLSFFHSSLVVFKKTENTKTKNRLLLKALSIVLWNSLPIHFLFLNLNQDNKLIAIGLISSLCSLCIYWLSVKSLAGFKLAVIHGNIDDNQIYKKGLFKIIRHPFYSSYIVCYLGVLLVYPTLFHFIVIGVLLYIYYKAAQSEERQFISGPLKKEYSNYCKSTGMFFPKVLVSLDQ